MPITFRKRRFISHFARSHDRRASVLAAGYAETSWARTATRLLADGEIRRLLELEEERLAKHEAAAKLSIDDVVAQLGEMLTVADEAPGRRGWSAKLKILETLARVLTNKREEMQPSEADAPNKPLTDAALHERIAELERELQGKSEQTPAPAPSDRTECHPLSTNAPAASPAAITVSDSQVAAKAPVLNMSANEREDRCDRHGSFVAVRRGSTWSFCPVCCAEAARYERWLANLAPAGGRGTN